MDDIGKPAGGGGLDPVYVHARREAWIIMAAWTVCIAWSVGYSARYGYSAGEGAADGGVDTTLGLPSWIFWGIALPWALATVFSIAFALFGMAEDDLGQEADTDEPDAPNAPDAPDASRAPDAPLSASAGERATRPGGERR